MSPIPHIIRPFDSALCYISCQSNHPSSTVSHNLHSVTRRSQFTLFRSCKPGDPTPVTVSMQNTNAKRIYRYYIDLTKFKALKHAPNGSKHSLCQHITTVSVSRQSDSSQQVSQKRAKLTLRAPPHTAQCHHPRGALTQT